MQCGSRYLPLVTLRIDKPGRVFYIEQKTKQKSRTIKISRKIGCHALPIDSFEIIHLKKKNKKQKKKIM